jgi:hypothetical protein
VSRPFIARTPETLLELMSRRLDDVRLAVGVLMLDGIELKGRTNVVAPGTRTDGVKIPLGLRERSSENKTVDDLRYDGTRPKGTARPSWERSGLGRTIRGRVEDPLHVETELTQPRVSLRREVADHRDHSRWCVTEPCSDLRGRRGRSR